MYRDLLAAEVIPDLRSKVMPEFMAKPSAKSPSDSRILKPKKIREL